MQAIFDRGHDAEIAAPAAQAPVKIRVFLVVRPQKAPVGGHDVERGGVIAGQPEAPAQPAQTAAEREARGAGVRDGARGCGQPESGAFMVELPEERPRLKIGAPGLRIDPHTLHLLQVDHQAAIATRLA